MADVNTAIENVNVVNPISADIYDPKYIRNKAKAAARLPLYPIRHPFKMAWYTFAFTPWRLRAAVKTGTYAWRGALSVYGPLGRQAYKGAEFASRGIASTITKIVEGIAKTPAVAETPLKVLGTPAVAFSKMLFGTSKTEGKVVNAFFNRFTHGFLFGTEVGGVTAPSTVEIQKEASRVFKSTARQLVKKGMTKKAARIGASQAAMESEKAATKLATTQAAKSTAIKVASHILLPAVIAYDVFTVTNLLTRSAFGAFEYVRGGLSKVAENMNKLEFGGKLYSSYMTQAATTERQKAIQAMQMVGVNSNVYYGNEASIMHGMVRS